MKDFSDTLTDETAWQEATQSEDDMQDAYDWLTNAMIRVQADLSTRKAEFEMYASSEYHDRNDFKKTRAEFMSWKAKANRFRMLCDVRRRELDGRLEKVRQKKVDRDNELKTVRNALIKLSVAVLDHEFDQVGDDELYDLLDSIKIPHGESIETLREIAEEIPV